MNPIPVVADTHPGHHLPGLGLQTDHDYLGTGARAAAQKFLNLADTGSIHHRHIGHIQDEPAGRLPDGVQHLGQFRGPTEEKRPPDRKHLDAGRQTVVGSIGRTNRTVEIVQIALDQVSPPGLDCHQFGHAVHEQNGSQDHPDLDRDRQIDQHCQGAGQDQHQPVAHRRRQEITEAIDVAHVPRHHQQHRRKAGQRDIAGQRCQDQHEGQHEQCMQHPGDRRKRARADIGGGPGDRPGRRQPGEQCRSDIGHPLRHQLAVGAVMASGHAIGDHCRQQAFHSGQKGNGERGRQ